MPDKSEREKMLSNELYLATDKELVAMQLRANKLLQQLNLNNLQERDTKWIIGDLFGWAVE